MKEADWLEIRNTVASTLSGLLGTYQFPDGTTAPAIALLRNREDIDSYPPAATVTTGLECAIVVTTLTNRPLLDGQVFAPSVRLLLYQYESSQTVLPAIEAINAALPVEAITRSLPNQPNQVETAIILIPQFYYCK